MNHTFIGIDVGTSAMKLVLIDEKKNVLAQDSCKYQIERKDNGEIEIDPQIWFNCMKKGMHHLLSGQDPMAITGIGVTGQMHSLITLDKQGNPVCPVMLWNDTRTKDLIPELKEKMRTFQEGEYLSRTVSTGCAAASLYWMKKYMPDSLKKVDKFLIGPDYLVYRLTGVTGTDYCEASTSCLYRIYDRTWSAEMRELLGLDESVYPEIRGSAVAAGTVLPQLAAEFGISPNVTVIVGTGDNPATAISTGCLGKGYPVLSLGTSGVLMMPLEKPQENSRGKQILFSFDGKKFSYLLQGAVQNNGSTLDWWNSTILNQDNYQELTDSLDPNHITDENLVFYPHLGGDKTIYADPNIRGAFVGLSTDTTREDLAYVVIEGLCFGFRELAEKMGLSLQKFGSVKVVGGGSRSSVWLQIMANVMNIRIEKLGGMTGAAFGIALLSAYERGYIHSTESLSEGNVIVEKYFIPQTKASERCEKKYLKYLRIHHGLQYILNGQKL